MISYIVSDFFGQLEMKQSSVIDFEARLLLIAAPRVVLTAYMFIYVKLADLLIHRFFKRKLASHYTFYNF